MSEDCPNCQLYKMADCPRCFGDPETYLRNAEEKCTICNDTGVIQTEQKIDYLYSIIEGIGKIVNSETMTEGSKILTVMGIVREEMKEGC